VLQNESQYLVIRAYDTQGNLITPINYRLYDEGMLVQAGTLKQDIVEKIDKLKNNTNYTMITDHRQFYQSRTVCLSNYHQCLAYLIRYPNIKIESVFLKDGYYRILVYIENGRLMDSVLCLSDNTMRVTQTKLTRNGTELIRVNIPERSRLSYDRCYYPVTNTTFPLSDGLYEYDLVYLTDPVYSFSENSRIEIALIDSYTMTQQRDVDVPDYTEKIFLIENV
jgi:hypothetical protein